MLLTDQVKPIELPEHPNHAWWRCSQELGLCLGAPEPPNPYIFVASDAQRAFVPAGAEELTYGF